MTRLTMTQRISVYLLAGLLSIVSAATAQAITVVSPAGLEDEDGNVLFFPNVPFPDSFPGPPAWRAQEVHPSSAFESLGPGPLVITGLAWRPDISVNQPTSADWELTLNLSTTQTDPLSMTFADNYGPGGFTEVFSGALQLQTDGVPRGGGLPHDFDYVVDFATPFPYDPQQGNLLVEWISPTDLTDAWIWVDADDRTGEYIVGVPSDAAEAFAGGPGLFVTQFTVIPEPSSWLLCLSGFAAVLFVVARRRS